MPAKEHIIKVDETTSTTLSERAAERGLSVSELVAELAEDASSDLEVDSEQVAELDRRWAAHQAKGGGASHDEVVRWLATWGTPAFEPWPDR